jgi:multiple sugar transport system permease protein
MNERREQVIMEKVKNKIGGNKFNLSTSKIALTKTKQVIIGKEVDKGLLFKLFLYIILFDMAYIYLNPILYMITSMFMDAKDLLNPAVIWVPTSIYLGVLQETWEMINYPRAFLVSTGLATSLAIFQTSMCAVAGYAFARLEFPFKKTLFFGLILSFIVPPQLVTIPNIILFRELNLLNTFYPIILPTLFGHGLKGALFVIIYRQFFSTQPKELEEAAKIDGASVFRIFYKVMLPLARPAIVVVFLFSFVWNWNDYYFASLYLSNSDFKPLSMGITQVASELALKAEESGESLFDESIKMAASFLIILPPLLLYLFTQKWFVEGVERTGLVE